MGAIKKPKGRGIARNLWRRVVGEGVGDSVSKVILIGGSENSGQFDQ